MSLSIRDDGDGSSDDGEERSRLLLLVVVVVVVKWYGRTELVDLQWDPTRPDQRSLATDIVRLQLSRA